MRAVFISACLVLLVTIATPEAWSAVINNGVCREGAVYVGGQCLSFSTDALSWHEAKKSCSSQHGQLASLKDPYAVLSYVDHHYDAVEFWAGGSDITTEGTWIWLTGEPLVQFPWGPHEPNNYGELGQEQNCLVVNWNDGYDDQSCDVVKNYICEYESEDSSDSSDSSEELECPEGFFIPPGSSHQCLKFFGEKPRNWFDANIKCGENGLRLAKPFNALALRAYLVERYGPDARVHVGAKGTGSKMVWEHDGRELGAHNNLWRNCQPGNKINTNYCLEVSAREYEMSQEPEKAYWPGLCSIEIFTLCEFVE